MFDQISFFDAPLYKIDKPIRLIELFAGIGSQAKALRNIGADFEHYRICEFDEYAVKSYNAIHGTQFQKSDITQITAADLGIVDKGKYCYILCYSFPCQDLSVAGLGKGMAKGSGTRSGLLWEVERLLDECTDLPQILLMENVTQVHGQKNIRHFRDWLVKLESLGYRNYFQDLNAKGFEVPQNRDRTFMVSILGEYMYKFPTPKPLTLRLKDVLEEKVDEKYYLSENTVRSVIENHCPVTAISEPKVIKICNLFQTKTRDNPNQGRLYDTEGISPCLDAMQGGQRQPFIIDDKYNVSEKGVRYICSPKRGMATDINADIAQTITASGQANWTGSFIYPDIKNLEKSSTIGSTTPVKVNMKDGSFVFYDGNNHEVLCNKRVRKLTPRECYRLMGFSDDDFDKASAVNSNNQLYKQAGNSICVPVLEAIFKQFF